MSLKTESLNKFFEKIKNISFFERLFSWKPLLSLSYDAYDEYKSIVLIEKSVDDLKNSSKEKEQSIIHLKENISRLESEIQTYRLTVENKNKNLQEKESEIGGLKESIHKYKQRIDEINQNISENKGTIEQNNKILLSKESKISKLEESILNSEKQVKDLLNKISSLEGNIEQKIKISQEKENEIGSLKESIKKYEERVNDLNQEIAEYKGTIELNYKNFNEIKQQIGEQIEGNKKNLELITSLNKDIAYYESLVEQNNKEFKSKESEIGKLNESKINNQEKINELDKLLVLKENIIVENNKLFQKNENEIGALKEANEKDLKRIIDLEKEIEKLNTKLDGIRYENTKLENQVSAFKESEELKASQFDHKVTELNSLKKQLDDDRLRLQKEREDELEKKFEEMKLTWKNHEDNVQYSIMDICTRNNIEYIEKEKIPFKGKPDNTIKIAGEFIIFDAKSPQGDDLTNFPKYIKNQTEYIKKYIKEENVKKDIFLVVPTNTIEFIKIYYHNMVDYRVYVVTIDSLEAIILNMQKIEEYEFAEQLSPEDRENICRIIGKFAHGVKRKIQIDTFMNKQFFNILSECMELPEDIISRVIEFEKSDKLNPPMEKRAKQISSREIKKEIKMMEIEASARNINIDNSLEVIDKLPLNNNQDLLK